MELFDATLGVAEWYSVLNWDCLPDMGSCHSFAAAGEQEEFLQRYVITGELRRFYGTILEKLKTKRIGQPVVLLKGDPGIGKTTFIYSLKSHVTNNEELNKKYVFYACHANSIDTDDWEHEVVHHTKQALKEYYLSCNQKDLYRKLCGDDGDNISGKRRQISKLKTCMAGSEHRFRFEKTLVFVLDNVDTVTNHKRVVDAFQLINLILEPGIIKKWFVVRPETINRYPSSERNRLESFVSDHLTVPSVSLYEVAKKRVQNTTGNKKGKINPFSAELCNDIVLPFCKGNTRRGLSVLEAILRDTAPKGFVNKNADERVIQNYIRKNAMLTMYKEGLVRDLHGVEYSTKSLETPMAYDLLCLAKFSSNERTLRAMLYKAIERRNSNVNYEITGRDNKFIIHDHEFDKLLNLLAESGLIFRDKRSEVTTLTALGAAHIDIATPKYYMQICKKHGSSTRTDSYWRASAVDISHASIAKNFSTSPII